jgi:hypothetical protein
MGGARLVRWQATMLADGLRGAIVVSPVRGGHLSRLPPPPLVRLIRPVRDDRITIALDEGEGIP